MLWSFGKIPTQIVILTAATLPIDITQHRCLNLYLWINIVTLADYRDYAKVKSTLAGDISKLFSIAHDP